MHPALLQQLRRAVREHDTASLRALDDVPLLHDGSRVHATLAFARYAATGLAEALPLLQALYRTARSASPAVERAKALSTLAGAKTTRLSGSSGLAPWYRDVVFPVVDVAIGGAPPAPMIVDTGAEETLLSSSFCERHGIRPATDLGWTAFDASGSPLALKPAIVDIRFGDLIAHDALVSVAAFPPELGVAGLLAPQRSFPGRAIVFDDDAVRIVSSRRARAEERPYGAQLLWNGTALIVGARAADRCVPLLVDSGAPETSIDPRIVPAQRPLPRDESRSFSGRVSLAGVSDTMLAVGDGPARCTTVFGVRTERRDDGTLRGVPHHGLLGFSWLRATRAVIDTRTRLLRFDDVAAEKR